MAGAQSAVRGIEKLRWGFYIVVIVCSITFRLRPMATAVSGASVLVLLFFIYTYFISKLDCPYCERSLRFLWTVLHNVTTCPFCGKKIERLTRQNENR